jgi:hypothetical protein
MTAAPKQPCPAGRCKADESASPCSTTPPCELDFEHPQADQLAQALQAKGISSDLAVAIGTMFEAEFDAATSSQGTPASSLRRLSATPVRKGTHHFWTNRAVPLLMLAASALLIGVVLA